MADRIKRMVAVAFVVASVPVLLSPGKFTYTFVSKPEALTSHEGDKLAKELIALRQKVSRLEEEEAEAEHAIRGPEASAGGVGESRRLGLDRGNRTRRGHDLRPGQGAEDASRRLGDQTTLERRAVYTRWGSKSCPMGSRLLYSGFVGASDTTSGSGYNYLCMHPNPQLPSGWNNGAHNGALLFPVEYANSGTLDKNQGHDTACAVCQWQNGASVYVEWGNGELRDNPDPADPKRCSIPEHEMIYTGLIMSSSIDNHRAENICVDSERAYHGDRAVSEVFRGAVASTRGGLLYTSEMRSGSADEAAYPDGRELGCTVCGVPARGRRDALTGVVTVTPSSETSVFTAWGKRQCPESADLVYAGFIAGARSGSSGGGANYICMTITGATPPSGYDDGLASGNRLYGSEYRETGSIDPGLAGGDAACAVCRYAWPHSDVYVQWGRSYGCQGSPYPDVYQGYVMGSDFVDMKSTHECVHKDAEVHGTSSPHLDDGALLFTTELETQQIPGYQYIHEEVGCSACAGATGKSVFTRWGSQECPVPHSTLAYTGHMMSEKSSHSGGGANTICMHRWPRAPTGATEHYEGLGNELYMLKYADSGAIDVHNNRDAACAVCSLESWESVYTQWGRSTTCTNGHITLYTGFVMAELSSSDSKGEYVCVDSARAATSESDTGEEGGRLFTTEMRIHDATAPYPNNVEVGCAVCAAQREDRELPFVMQDQSSGYFRNAIHGEWVNVRSVATGQEVSVLYGFKKASGTSSSDGERQQSAQERAIDISQCSSASYTEEVSDTVSAEVSFEGVGPGFSVGVSTSVGFASSTGSSACGGGTDSETTSVMTQVIHETLWEQSSDESVEFSFSIPSEVPPGVPEADAISSRGVDVWQWRWTIVESGGDGVNAKMYHASAHSKFVYTPVGGPERRPCCYPGQEWAPLWYPFNCKTEQGLLPGARFSASHCRVGPPGQHPAAGWSSAEVEGWLGRLSLSTSFDAGTVVATRKLDGRAMAPLLHFIDESPSSYSAVKHIFGITADGSTGDALKILKGLVDLRNEW